VIEEITKLVNGAAILKEWVGEGSHPVNPGKAQARADVCFTCPNNTKGHWWNTATNKLAETIRAHLEIKNQIGLRVFGEADLGTCAVCHCNLPLKVHVPIKHIHAHTSETQLNQFPANCWIPTEIKS
jgi:hypothetical protein